MVQETSVKKKILIVDDDRELGALLRECLAAEGMDSQLQFDGESGLAAALEGDFSLIVLDVMLPGRDGFSVLSQLRETMRTPVLMLTARGEEGDKVSGLRMGADDYLTKPFGIGEFLARAHALIRRYTVFQKRFSGEKGEGTGAGAGAGLGKESERPGLCAGPLRMDMDRRVAEFAGQSLSLTAKEFEVIYLLASHPRQVFTKKQIYGAVWEEDDFDEGNLTSYLSKLRGKLERQGAGRGLIETVWGVGYRFGEEL